MSLATLPVAPAAWGVLRHSRWDALLIGLAFAHGALLFLLPSAPVIALGLWWNSNTISHNFIHKPFFRSRTLNLFFGLYLSALLGVPQSVWRARHLAHHAGLTWRLRATPRMILETLVVLAVWAALFLLAPRFFLAAYLPGYAAGLLLCWLHGHYEHTRGTVSHYGALYNLLFFNDGYHAEHHARPGTHWRHLPEIRQAGAETSAWPAPLRWVELFSLNGLERMVLRSPRLQRFVLDRHERAFRTLLPALPASPSPRVAVVGGGLFPRSPLVLNRLLPSARLLVVDKSAANIAMARTFLNGHTEFLHASFVPEQVDGCDLVVFPLAYVGDRAALYRDPPAPIVIVHDWSWRRRGASAVVSLLLLKRINLVRA
jgi:hypothetical protein